MIENPETTQTETSQTPDMAPTPPEPPRPTRRTRSLGIGERRLLALVVPAGILISGSLFLPWYTYNGFGNEFTAKGWKVFSSLDIVLAAVGVAMALPAGATLMGRLRATVTRSTILAASLVAVGLVVYRLIERPYTENYEVTPHAGLILAGVCAVLTAAGTAYVLLRAGGAGGWLGRVSDWMATPRTKSPPPDES